MDASTFESVIDIPGWLGSLLNTAIPIVIVLILVCYFHYRAGTSYGFVSRLYTLLAGRSDYHDGTLEEYWKKHKDLERFNAVFNFKAKSLQDAHRLVNWFDEYDLDHKRFARLKSWFDVEKLEIRETTRTQIFILFLLGVTLVAPTVICTDAALKNAALIKFNDETRWLWLGHDQAYSVTYNPIRDRSEDWRLTKQNCGKETFDAESVASATGLKAKTITSICDSFTNSTDDEYINGVIEGQTLFLPPALPLAYWVLISFAGVFRRLSVIGTTAYLVEKKRNKTEANEQSSSSSARPTEPAQETSEIAS